MVYYISSNIYNQTVYSTIKELDQLIVGQQVGNHFLLLKFIKQNVNMLSCGLDFFIIDTSCLDDTEEDVIQAIKMFRTLNETVRIIILSPERIPGDALLAQIFALGVWNIIATMDYFELKSQLISCMEGSGKSFKEALEFKDVREIEQSEKKDIKTVSRVMLGVAGSQPGIGSTHNAILLAGTLRKKGFLVAIVEVNPSSDFEKIRQGFEMKIHEHSYFTMNGIDYYPDATEQTLKLIGEKSYNFIVLDFGEHRRDQERFDKCHVRFLVTGSKSWELEYAARVLQCYGEEELQRIHFYFNFTAKEYEKPIRKNFKSEIGAALNVHFLKYCSDPFNVYEFPDIDKVLVDYLPSVVKQKRKICFSILYSKKSPKRSMESD